MDEKQEADLNQPLPQSVIPGPNLTKEEQAAELKEILEQTLPPSEAQTASQDLKWTYTLEKQPIPNPFATKRRSRRPRKAQRLLLPQKPKTEVVDYLVQTVVRPLLGWSYSELIPMRNMWREYMKRMIGKPCVKEDNRSLGMILGKCEFVGGEVKIEKCSTDSMVGMQGIIIKETRNYFTIVNDKSKTKMIPKYCCVFTFLMENAEVTVFGPQLMTRPPERSVKKIKGTSYADI